RRMMRANMKYDSVPMELKFKSHHVKPRLVLICDVSTSMRYCAEFLLTLIYELQDQVAKTDSFIFISDLTEISMVFKEMEPMTAVEKVLTENRPGYYNTDLGNSLNTFRDAGCVTSKTTIIILGDGRNNYNDPRLDIIQDLQRRDGVCVVQQAAVPVGRGQRHAPVRAVRRLPHVSNLREQHRRRPHLADG
ncbi:MAG: VWA domain-containing protein, partial [Anaerolineae bacterium]|nr:VWA domain-containing protein [Anaerolineae bacterium]